MGLFPVFLILDTSPSPLKKVLAIPPTESVWILVFRSNAIRIPLSILMDSFGFGNYSPAGVDFYA